MYFYIAELIKRGKHFRKTVLIQSLIKTRHNGRKQLFYIRSERESCYPIKTYEIFVKVSLTEC